jgi:hypothetical protein
LLLFAFGACSSAQSPADQGDGVDVVLMALTPADVASVTVTVTGAGIEAPIVASLSLSNNQWRGTIGGIPAGSGRTFTLSARNTAGVEVYRGVVTDVTVTPGRPTTVMINAQQVSPAPARRNAAPVIDGLLVSSLTVAPEEVVRLEVRAHDPDSGDVLTYAWEANGGVFAEPTQPSTNWTAPVGADTYQITITVRDPKDAGAVMSVDIAVAAGNARGSARVTGSLNTWPVVENVTAAPTRIDVGETTALDVVAADSDGDALSYAWNADCDGSFSSVAAKSPSFKLSLVPATKACTFTVVVADGREGTNTGSVTIAAGPAPATDLAPRIISTYQSQEKARAGQSVVLQVTAVDPDGTALTFAWENPLVGTLGTPSNTADTSEVVWTAPSSFGAAVEVRVTITDGTGHPTGFLFGIAPEVSEWVELTPSGGPPPARHASYQAVGFDELNNRLLFFGGLGANGVSFNDTWVLVGADGTSGAPQWIQLVTQNTPAPHRGHAGAYDAVNNRLIVYGGCLGQCTPMDNSVYVLSNANGLGGTPVWQLLSPTGSAPTVRDDHTAVYEPGSNRLIVFGGDNCCGGRFNDTWILTNANGLGGTPTWLQLAPSGTLPPARAGHMAACDSANNRMMVFGGNGYGSFYNDTWVLANANGLGGTATWTQLAPTGPLPAARSGFALDYDQSANSVVVFGGSSAPGILNDVWLLANANGLGGASTWTQVLTGANGPTPRSSSLSGYSPASRRLIVFGGHDGTSPVNDLWALPLGGD